jgi:hypothetical protein
MKGIPIKAVLTGLINESNSTMYVEAIADLSDCKHLFTVHSFKNTATGEALQIEEVAIRYVAETTVPHWIDEKHKLPSILSQELGKAIEATQIGKEYVALCFLRASN